MLGWFTTKRNLQPEGSLLFVMAKEDWRNKIGTIVMAIVIITLAVVIYFVVSGQWGNKRFRGIEKFRGDHTERFEPALVVAPVSEGHSLGV